MFSWQKPMHNDQTFSALRWKIHFQTHGGLRKFSWTERKLWSHASQKSLRTWKWSVPMQHLSNYSTKWLKRNIRNLKTHFLNFSDFVVWTFHCCLKFSCTTTVYRKRRNFGCGNLIQNHSKIPTRNRRIYSLYQNHCQSRFKKRIERQNDNRYYMIDDNISLIKFSAIS